MLQKKERLTVTVDRTLVQAATEAVQAGRADSLSAWVNRALAERAEKERRLVALAEAIASYESRYGEISDGEMLAQEREDRGKATVIRVQPGRKRRSRVA